MIIMIMSLITVCEIHWSNNTSGALLSSSNKLNWFSVGGFCNNAYCFM